MTDDEFFQLSMYGQFFREIVTKPDGTKEILHIKPKIMSTVSYQADVAMICENRRIKQFKKAFEEKMDKIFKILGVDAKIGWK